MKTISSNKNKELGLQTRQSEEAYWMIRENGGDPEYPETHWTLTEMIKNKMLFASLSSTFFECANSPKKLKRRGQVPPQAPRIHHAITRPLNHWRARVCNLWDWKLLGAFSHSQLDFKELLNAYEKHILMCTNRIYPKGNSRYRLNGYRPWLQKSISRYNPKWENIISIYFFYGFFFKKIKKNYISSHFLKNVKGWYHIIYCFPYFSIPSTKFTIYVWTSPPR